MNVMGLKNLGLPEPTSRAGEAKSNANKGGSTKDATRADVKSFERLLGQIQKEKVQPNKDNAPQAKGGQSQNSGGQSQSKDKNTGERSRDPIAPAKTDLAKKSATATPTAAKPAREAVKSTVDRLVSEQAPVAASDTSDETVDAESMDMPGEEALPSSPSGFPSLGGPSLSERALGTPFTPKTVGAAAGKQTGEPVEDSANTLTRRVVWNDFLRKMNDLGISAEDVMGAFASLTDQELAQPPEQSVDKVVMALGLDPAQAQLARQYFNDLVHKTNAKSMGEELNNSSKQISLTLMSQRDVQRKALQTSIDKMERSFFMQSAQARGRLPGGLDGAMGDDKLTADSARAAMIAQAGDDGARDPGAMMLPSLQDAALSGPQAFADSSMAVPMGAQAPLTTSSSAEEINQLVDQMQNVSGDDKRVLQEVVKNFNMRQAMGGAHAAGIAPAMAGAAPAAAPTAGSAAHAVSTASQEAITALNNMLSGGRDSASSGGEDLGDDSADPSLMTGAVLGENRMGHAGALNKSEFQNQMAQASGQGPQPMTVPDLVQKAQIMVTKGGGEMKVTMNPEGLGEVAMRVSVEGGKVSVQMVTESDEAKKLIERSIGDLKSGLAQNHLQIDTIKVDTATNLGKQLDQQYQDAQRQAAHQNLEQFRQDQQGWRRSFFDSPNVRQYRNQNDAPRDAQAPTSSTSSAKRAASRRLDLVA